MANLIVLTFFLSLFVLLVELSSFPSVFRKWKKRDISPDLVICFGHHLTQQYNGSSLGRNFQRLSLLEIKEEQVSVTAFDAVGLRLPSDSGPARRADMKEGIKSAVQAVIKRHKRVQSGFTFPNIVALLIVHDLEILRFPMNYSYACNSSTYDFPPPIFAMNDAFDAENLLVTLPDFSFFTDFSFRGHHGEPSEAWFPLLKAEILANASGQPSPFAPTSLSLKPNDMAVWRGTVVSNREWMDVRKAVVECFVDSSTEMNLTQTEEVALFTNEMCAHAAARGRAVDGCGEGATKTLKRRQTDMPLNSSDRSDVLHALLYHRSVNVSVVENSPSKDAAGGGTYTTDGESIKAVVTTTRSEFRFQPTFLDANLGSYLSKRQMCSSFKLLLTIPGNGYWSWATKYNLLCNSVTLLIKSSVTDGESWETRHTFGLTDGVHYLSITDDPTKICSDIEQKVDWVKKHPEEAAVIARNGRKYVFDHLNQHAVLLSLGNLLSEYAFLQRRSS